MIWQERKGIGLIVGLSKGKLHLTPHPSLTKERRTE